MRLRAGPEDFLRCTARQRREAVQRGVGGPAVEFLPEWGIVSRAG